MIKAYLMRWILWVTALITLSHAAGGNAVGRGEGWYAEWECAFERDHVPPVTPEAEALFQEARTLERDTYTMTEADKTRVFTLYKQATDMGHWKAMFNLATCYIKGQGTPFSAAKADGIYEGMMARGIPAGFYGKAMLTRRGTAVPHDPKKAADLLHKAADLGSPPAQYDLGVAYIYIKDRDRQGLAYLVCALRQGYAVAGKELGFFLKREKNPLKAVEYYYRAAKLGDYSSIIQLEEFFLEHESVNKSRPYRLGYNLDKPLAAAFASYLRQIEDHTLREIPDLFSRHPIPPHPTISREQSRAMPSKLKDAFGGKWPDEIFPELAPDYMPPR